MTLSYKSILGRRSPRTIYGCYNAIFYSSPAKSFLNVKIFKIFFKIFFKYRKKNAFRVKIRDFSQLALGFFFYLSFATSCLRRSFKSSIMLSCIRSSIVRRTPYVYAPTLLGRFQTVSPDTSNVRS